MRLTTDEVKHIAALAKISMTDDDVDQIRSEMSSILDHFDVLQNIDTDGVEPMDNPMELKSVTREDKVRVSMDPEAVLANAPRSEKPFIKTRAVLD